MRTGTVHLLDPSIIVSLTAAALLLTVLITSQAMGRIAHTLVQTGWLYLSNTRG